MKSQPLLQSALLLLFGYIVTFTVMQLAVSNEYQVITDLFETKIFFLILLAPILLKFAIQLISLPLYPIIESFRSSGVNSRSKSKVTVLIPAWNEEIGIIKTLNSVINTKYSNLEIIVINDGSTDKTHQLVSDFIEKYENINTDRRSAAVIKYIKLPNGGKAVAMNHGLKIASGEFVITLDADSLMDPSMIKNMLARFTDEKVAAVAGNVVIGNRRRPLELVQQLEYLNGFCFKRADSNFNSVHIIGGAAAGYRKSSLLEVGGFDENIITEDIEISTRLLAQGYKTRYAANAVVFTEGPSDWKSLGSQRLRWKFGRMQTYLKHSSLFCNPSSKYNPYLTCLVLPVAIYVEFILLLEPIILTLFYTYTILANDYWPLAFMILFTASIITLQILCDPKTKFHRNLFLMAPIAWLVFYIIELVEFQALYRALNRFAKKQNLEWQTWSRVGILSSTVARSVNHSSIAVLERES